MARPSLSEELRSQTGAHKRRVARGTPETLSPGRHRRTHRRHLI